MRILVIGGGGRESALVWKLSESAKVDKIFAAPGNPGMAAYAECVNIDVKDNLALLSFAEKNGVDLTVVGPEAPLLNGISDLFSAHGLKIFGPSKSAAEIEGSKAFAKALMKKYDIPTAGFAVFSNAKAAKDYILAHGAPIVVKADGLAAGKGVIVAESVEAALRAVDLIMGESVFGEAGKSVVIEEFMQGEEASLLIFTDGESAQAMVAAQDHKRIFDGDKGPNTGGMGAYAPAPVISADMLDEVMKVIVRPTIEAMRQEGLAYKGCLYVGLMITEEGPKVVEYNARFGDPETQVVLALLDSDLAEIMLACVDGALNKSEIKWKDEAAVCVVMAAGGYPGDYRKGDIIKGLDQALLFGATIFHAGTALDADKNIVTNGGRVLGVTAVDKNIAAAADKAYKAVDAIDFSNKQYRKDIAGKAIQKNRLK